MQAELHVGAEAGLILQHQAVLRRGQRALRLQHRAIENQRRLIESQAVVVRIQRADETGLGNLQRRIEFAEQHRRAGAADQFKAAVADPAIGGNRGDDRTVEGHDEAAQQREAGIDQGQWSGLNVGKRAVEKDAAGRFIEGDAGIQTRRRAEAFDRHHQIALQAGIGAPHADVRIGHRPIDAGAPVDDVERSIDDGDAIEIGGRLILVRRLVQALEELRQDRRRRGLDRAGGLLFVLQDAELAIEFPQDRQMRPEDFDGGRRHGAVQQQGADAQGDGDLGNDRDDPVVGGIHHAHIVGAQVEGAVPASPGKARAADMHCICAVGGLQRGFQIGRQGFQPQRLFLVEAPGQQQD